MSFHVVIPARWASTRLPGKMLADIAGTPMVIRVAQSASQSSAKTVVIATDHEQISQAALEHGFKAVMTRGDHPTGTDRLAQAADLLDLAHEDIVINVQGDEPMIDPGLIDELAACLIAQPQAFIATAASPITDESVLNNPNAVKVVRDASGCALYFSRAAIPFMRNRVENLAALHHIGIYAYRASFLRTFPRLTPGLLEQAESLEQLRALEHGFKIHVLVTSKPHAAGIDTATDLELARAVFSQRKAG
jgi:3-deoxy-manno-octulosonate cytidylyltransferase (CMP-KDO synthetase)